MPDTIHFKSKEAERKNLAYRHMHGIPYTKKTACVGDSCHEVKHSKSKSRVAINRKQKLKDRKLGASGRTGKYTHGRRKRGRRKRT